MAVHIHIFLNFEQLDPKHLYDLSTVLERYGIDTGQFFSARMTEKGLFVDQEREVRRRAS